MNSVDFEEYCHVRGIEVHPELFEKYEYGFFHHVDNDDNLFEFLGDLIKEEQKNQPDHRWFTICAILRYIMHKAMKDRNMHYYWAAKLATVMAKSMSGKLEWYKNEFA